MKTIQPIFKILSLMLAFSALIFITSCGGGSDSTPQADDANAYLNDNLILPPGSFRVDASQTTETTDINVTSTGSGTVTQVVGGQAVNVSIPFTASNSNVTHAGIRFGTTGDIIMVPISGASGNSAGVLEFQFGIPPGICDNLNQICHDIRCYEFAVAGSGDNTFQVSRANINQLASACGGCDEPQCVALLGDGCGAAGGDGNPRFNLTWSPQGIDLDLHVTDPSGERIYYGNRSSASGGELDVDCTRDCTNENITWPNGGPSGTYSFYVDHFSGSSSASWQLRVFDGGRVVSSQSGTLASGQESSTFTYSR